METITRRKFLQTAFTSSIGLSGLNWPIQVYAKQQSRDPHFFLIVFFQGGLDWSYLFDARPLTMSNTENGVIQNYLGEEPNIWMGSNGGQTLASPLTNSLSGLKHYFSVVNGLHMAPTFDGHGPNISYLYCGSPFGGSAFIPNFNQNLETPLPMDCIKSGPLSIQFTNGTGTITLKPEESLAFINQIKNQSFALSDSMTQFISEQIQNARSGKGHFSKGASEMHSAFRNISPLSQKLKQVDFALTESPFQNALRMVGTFFREGIATGAVIPMDDIYDGPNRYIADTHDLANAKKQKEMFPLIVRQMGELIDFLRNTPFNGSTSLYDVTTFMYASEFGRTMRQKDLKIDSSATDHNQFNNSIIIGGKGIRTGQVFGETDFRSIDEILSGAHLSVDQDKLKCIGKPFDFNSAMPRTDKPDTYDIKDYFSYASIVNSLFYLFGCPPKDYWDLGRNLPKAPVIPQLLKV